MHSADEQTKLWELSIDLALNFWIVYLSLTIHPLLGWWLRKGLTWVETKNEICPILSELICKFSFKYRRGCSNFELVAYSSEASSEQETIQNVRKNCSAWPKPKLNANICLHTTTHPPTYHHPPQTVFFSSRQE